MKDEFYMRRAIALARNGAGWTNPNPMVGAVIVKDDRIIGEGYHPRCGQLHAERQAIATLRESARGASIYVTLEPCCHYGKTPPCTEAILENGISRVVIGSRDPNPLVAGKGAKMLREHGVTVEEDFLREECDALNPVFFHYISTGRPYVVMKYAMTMDGKIATRTGASRWITGEEARNHVHRLRGRFAAILAGIGTVLADDPVLNCRVTQEEVAEAVAGFEGNRAECCGAQTKAHQPLRVIVDSSLRIPEDCKICRTAEQYPTVIACSVDFDRNPSAAAKKERLKELGINVIAMPAEDGRDTGEPGKSEDHPTVDLSALTAWLGQQKIDSVLIEGGGRIHEAALRAGIVDHVCAYVAPRFFGGSHAKTPVEGAGVELPDQAYLFHHSRIIRLGGDILIECDRKRI